MVAVEANSMKESGDRRAFDDEVLPLRGELVAYSYRFLGSWDEAEDAVQDVALRAWRAWSRFEARSSVRTWLYRITTNTCLDLAHDRNRRSLPPTSEQSYPWIQPVTPDRDDVRLALVVTLQVLPPTQRAVFLLREVLGFRAAEVADMLDTTVTAVKSSLQRARARIAATAPVPDDVAEPQSPTAQRLLNIYISAFENGDVEHLLTVLRSDATLELLPEGGRFVGKAGCAKVLTAAVGSPGEWRMQATNANGQPAAAVWLHTQPYGVAVLDTRESGIYSITVFADPELVERFTQSPLDS